MTPPKLIISTPNAPAPVGPYNQAIQAGQLLFVAGQVPLDAVTGKLIPETDVAAQTEQVMKNIQAILVAAGTDLASVVKTTVFLADLADYPAMNQVYGHYFPNETAPARSCVQVARLPLDVRVEIECIAIV